MRSSRQPRPPTSVPCPSAAHSLRCAREAGSRRGTRLPRLGECHVDAKGLLSRRGARMRERGRRADARAQRAPAERRHHLHGRHGLRGHRPVRCEGLLDAAPRPSRPRGARLHGLLCHAGCVLGVARGPHHRLLQRARRDHGRARAPLGEWTEPGRGDNRRDLQAEGLRHRLLRQVAPRPPPEVPADAAGLRRLLRPALLERHVAAPPRRRAPAGARARQALAAPSAHRRQQDRQPEGDTEGPGAAHHAVHRARGLVHREEQGPPLPPLRPAQHGARAALCLRQVQGQERRRHLRRRHDGDRLVGRRDRRDDPPPRPRRGHARHLHRRQRSVAKLRRPRGLGGPASRGQGDDVRRRLPRADGHVVAGHGPGRHRLPRTRDDHRRPPDRRQARRGEAPLPPD